MTIANQISIEVKTNQTKAVKALLNTLVENALLEKGCQKFELYQLDKEREYFFIVEIWKSEKAYNEHCIHETYLALKTELDPLIETERTRPLKLTQCLSKLGLKEKKERV